ncbi:protease B nonderepressible form [Recurvomyces mirabilis]|uniref:Protein PBN1 n=1 Tax=Recurvomyces mirabilis TaxID=574656 RepID=A0AAE0WRK6_9PEZI|nr:protease B nonderepressible form [Recurvomyces mirabilis]KAK5154920.1 protease B nonderepressible form [Recurvomyces mirabilis]
MKQRVTYFPPPGSDVPPSSVNVTSGNVDFPLGILPAVEKRITVGLSELPVEVARTFCPGQFRGDCPNEAASLSYASYIDIDFDVISHAVTTTAFWRAGIASPAARTPARKWTENDSLEVGVLMPEKADEDEPESIKMGGFLAVVGEDEGASSTLFSFPSRHHSLPPSSSMAFKVDFQQPTGLHPKLDIVLPRQHLNPPKDSCALHTYLTLPSALFIDRYQLSDPATLAEHNLKTLHGLSGEDDLEAPDWVVQRWGSAALIELAAPQDNDRSTLTSRKEVEWNAKIPLHLRYLQAEANATNAGYTDLEIPWPILFWACEAEEGLKMAVNPFDHVNLGYDGLFGPKTMFYHVPPSTEVVAPNFLEERITVPVLQPQWGEWVQVGTLVAVLVGFAWVCRGLVEGVGSDGSSGRGMKAEKKKE